MAETRHVRRVRPAKTSPPPMESGYRLVVEVESLPNPEEDNGWTVLALFAHVTMIQLEIDDQQIEQMYGVQPHHLLLCDALGLDHAWYEAPLVYKIDQFNKAP